MNKKLQLSILFVFLLGVFTNIQAQTYPQMTNGNMEAWTGLGTTSEEPANWNSFMSAQCDLGSFICGLAKSQQIGRSTDVRPGSTGLYSARIYSKNPIGSTIANGNMTTGIIRMGSSTPTSSDNYNYTKRSDAAHRMALNEVPDSLVFWAKYQPSNNSTTNTARVNAVIHNDNDYRDPNGTASQVVATATLNYNRTHDGSGYVWKRFSIPFVPTNNGAVPHYILITFTTNSIAGGGANNDQVWIDDIELIYNPKLNLGTINPLSFNVSPLQSASVTVPFTLTGPAGSIAAGNVVTAQLSNAAGSFSSPINLGTLTTTTSGTINGTIPAGTPAGTNYRIRVVTSNPTLTSGISAAISINTISNSIAPTSSQSILISQNGTTLTVSETPAATAREWKYSTTTGGPYLSFAPTETGASYTPNFATIGSYYIVCESQILGQTYTSNEVDINVNNISITTSAITGSPFEFSASAPNAAVSVPFVVNGGTMLAGNVFTAQLSDASGSFITPVNIGTLNGTSSGTITAQIPSNTPSGNAYRIRVISSNFPLNGGDNGSNLVVDQFSNSVSPATTQNIQVNLAGAPITVSESQTANRVWLYSTTSGGPYQHFAVAETNASYTPFFTTLGNYFVIAKSVNAFGDSIVSNEVELVVTNGTTIITTNLADSVFYVSANALINTTLDFNSNVIFNTGNTFTVEMSDELGSFASATTVGTLVSDVVAPISISIPNSVVNSSNYKFRVVSDDPVITGLEGNITGEAVEYAVALSNLTPQFLFQNMSGNPVNVNSTHPNTDFNWGIMQNSVFVPFNPAVQTSAYTPIFANAGVYHVAALGVNQWNDSIITSSFEVNVESVGLNEMDEQKILVVNQFGYWAINFTESNFVKPNIQLIDMSGRTIYSSNQTTQGWNEIPSPSNAGVYLLRLVENGKVFNVKLVKAN